MVNCAAAHRPLGGCTSPFRLTQKEKIRRAVLATGIHLEVIVSSPARVIPLFSRLRGGVGGEVAEPLHAWAPYVAAVAIRLIGRDDDIEDIVQDVFVEAMTGLKALREAD